MFRGLIFEKRNIVLPLIFFVKIITIHYFKKLFKN